MIFDPDEYQQFKYHRYVQKSYVKRYDVQKSYIVIPLSAPITIWEQSQTILLKIGPSPVPSHNLL